MTFRIVHLADDLACLHVVADLDVQFRDLTAGPKPKAGFICRGKLSRSTGLQHDIAAER